MRERTVAIAFILLGTLLFVGRAADADGALWTALAGIGFLVAYARQRVRGLLVLGCVLSGVAIGLLLGGLGIPGAFWISVGVALMAIDRIEPGPRKRVLRLGAAVTAFGLLWGVAVAGWVHDARLAIVLVLVGLLLLGDARPVPQESASRRSRGR